MDFIDGNLESVADCPTELSCKTQLPFHYSITQEKKIAFQRICEKSSIKVPIGRSFTSQRPQFRNEESQRLVVRYSQLVKRQFTGSRVNNLELLLGRRKSYAIHQAHNMLYLKHYAKVERKHKSASQPVKRDVTVSQSVNHTTSPVTESELSSVPFRWQKKNIVQREPGNKAIVPVFVREGLHV